MKKKELILNLGGKIGEHYFEILQFASIINLINEEVDFNSEISDKIEALLDVLKKEADKILDEDVDEI